MEQIRRAAREFWPLPVTLLMMTVQSDVLIAFSATWRAWCSLDLPAAIVVVVVIASVKMAWSYWFWGWVRELIADTARFQRLSVLAKQAASLVKGEGLVDRALAEAQLRHDQAHSLGRRLLTMTKWAACLFLLGVGAYPMWGTRGPLLVGVGLIRFREGFYALTLGNAIRALYLMGGLALVATWIR